MTEEQKAPQENDTAEAEDQQENLAVQPANRGILCSFKKLIKKCVGKDKPIVAVLRLSGVIGQAGSFKKGLTLDELDDDIEKAFSLPKECLKAVAVQVNSPGGSPVQSELIYRRIRTLSEEKNIPVITFVEDAAASGGYWLACAGDEIFVSENSIVGSIGVISSGFGFVEAIKKLGVERRVHTQGENKSIMDPFKPERKEDIDIIMGVQKDIHESFKDLVKERRKGKIKKKDENDLFSGEFWSGKQAVKLGLADGTSDMYTLMRTRYGTKTVFIKVTSGQGWLKRKFGMMASAIADSLVQSASNTATKASLWSRLGL